MGVGLAGSVFCFVSSVFAQEGFHKSPHLEHTTWLIGAKFIQYNAWEPGTEEEPNEVITGSGGGLLIERQAKRPLRLAARDY